MKTKLIILVLLLISGTSFSQGFHYGFTGGFTAATIIEKSEINAGVKKSPKYGYQCGVAAEFDVLSTVYISSALCFVKKGDKFKDQFAVSKASFGYFEMPIYVGYKVPIGNVYLSGNVGPYSSLAIVGKRSFTPDPDPETEPPFEWNFEETGHESNMDNTTEFFGDEWNSYKRFDSGLSFALRAGYQQYQLSASYSFSFIDIRPNETIKSTNSVLNISFIYFLKY